MQESRPLKGLEISFENVTVNAVEVTILIVSRREKGVEVALRLDEGLGPARASSPPR